MRDVTIRSTLLLMLLACLPVAAGEMETIVLEVEGMSSACCEDQFRWVLFDGAQGVGKVEADHSKGLVTIRFDAARVPVRDLVATINTVPSFRVTGSPSHALDSTTLAARNAAVKPCCAKGCAKRKPESDSE